MMDAKVVERLISARARVERSPLGELTPARARDPRVRRPRPQQPGDRRRAGAHQARGREAHQRDLPQARPHRGARRQPPREGGADLPRRDRHGLAAVMRTPLGGTLARRFADAGAPRATVGRDGLLARVAARAPAAAARCGWSSRGWRRRSRCCWPPASCPGAEVRGFARRGRSSRRSSRCSTRSCRRSSPRCGCRSRSAIGFLLVLALDAAMLLLAADIAPEPLHVDGFCGRAAGRDRRLRGQHGDRRLVAASTTTTATRCASRAASARRTGEPVADRRARDPLPRDRRARRCRSCAARSATARRRPWRAGSPTAPTRCSSGRPTCPRRPARARPGSCSATTTTSRRSAGSTRRPGRLVTLLEPATTARRSSASRDGRRGAARRRRDEPRQPALGRGRRARS